LKDCFIFGGYRIPAPTLEFCSIWTIM